MWIDRGTSPQPSAPLNPSDAEIQTIFLRFGNFMLDGREQEWNKVQTNRVNTQAQPT
jgi:hypothetical protein